MDSSPPRSTTTTTLQGEVAAIIRRQTNAAGANPALAVVRMAKQVEAGAVVTRVVLMSLAKRLEITDAEAWQIVAEANALRPPSTSAGG